MCYQYPDNNKLNQFNIYYGNECLNISLLENGVPTMKIKNHILALFKKIKYDQLELLIKDETDNYVVDEDELLYSNDEFIIFIK